MSRDKSGDMLFLKKDSYSTEVSTIKDWGLLLFFSFCSWMALFAEPQVNNLFGKGFQISKNFVDFDFKALYLLPTANITNSLVFILLFLFYRNCLRLHKKINTHLLIITVFFSFIITVGKSYHLFDNANLIISHTITIIVSVISIIGLSALFYWIITFLDSFLSNYFVDSNKCTQFNSKHFLTCIALLWGPIVIINLPGSGAFDFYAMLSMWDGNYRWTEHHPVFPVVLFGSLMDFGHYLGNDNLGAFLILLLQSIVILFAIFLSAKFVHSTLPYKNIFFILVLYYGCIPIFPAYAQLLYKDSLNMAFCLIFNLVVIYFVKDKDWLCSWKNFFVFILISQFVILMRNTGIYLVVMSLILLWMYYFRDRNLRKILSFLLLFVLLVNKAILPSFYEHLGIGKGPVAEMLSLPLQQTARYLKYYPNDISLSEKQTLEEIFNLSSLAESYNPNLSDPVKGRMKKQDPNSLRKYLCIWFSMFKKHPDIYMSATINSTYAYFYPDGLSKVFGTEVVTNSTKKSVKGPNFGHYTLTSIFSTNVKSKVNLYLNEYVRRIPVFGMAYNIGCYVIIMLLCFFYSVKTKNKELLLMLSPSLLSLLFCIASPVNGSVRYALPIIATLPILISLTFQARYQSR